jgi:hypothetical protein
MFELQVAFRIQFAKEKGRNNFYILLNIFLNEKKKQY